MGSFCPRLTRTTDVIHSQNLTMMPSSTPNQTLMSFGVYSPQMDIKSDCVVIAYLGSYLGLQAHPFVSSLKSKKSAHLLDAYSKQVKTPVKVGDSLLLGNLHPELQISQFLFVNFHLWGQSRKDDQLFRALERSLLVVQKQGYKNITLTYFEDHLGIPLNVGCRVLIGTLLQRNRAKGQRYTILFEDHTKLNYCLRYASQFTGEMSLNSVTTEY